MKPETASKDGYWVNVWKAEPFCASYWSGRVTEDRMFNSVYQSGVPWNDTYWEHERFNKLLLEVRVVPDLARRREIYHEMQKIVQLEGGSSA